MITYDCMEHLVHTQLVHKSKFKTLQEVNIGMA